MPLSVVTAKNTYPRVESYSETLADYDREVTEYYDLRSGSRLESFSHLVATNIGVGSARLPHHGGPQRTGPVPALILRH